MLQDQDQDRRISVSSGLETKTAVSRTTDWFAPADSPEGSTGSEVWHLRLPNCVRGGAYVMSMNASLIDFARCSLVGAENFFLLKTV